MRIKRPWSLGARRLATRSSVGILVGAVHGFPFAASGLRELTAAASAPAVSLSAGSTLADRRGCALPGPTSSHPLAVCTGEFEERAQIVDLRLGPTNPDEDLLGYALGAEAHHRQLELVGVLLHQPARQGRDPAAAGDHLQIERDDLQQPLIAGGALDADAQHAAVALGELAQAILGVGELRQQAIGHPEQKGARLGFTLGNLPKRLHDFQGDTLDNYFPVARGRSAPTAEAGHADHHPGCGCGVAAGEMTKWLDTKYHYIVPEFSSDSTFHLDPSRLLGQLAEAKAQRVKAKPVIIGPVIYLALDKSKDDSDRLDLLERLLPVYAGLLETLAAQGVDWVQVDEPILVTELDRRWRNPFEGRNIWKTDLNAVLDWLEPIQAQLGARLWIAPSCSLLHVPLDLDSERQLDGEIRTIGSFPQTDFDHRQQLRLG